MAMFLVFHNLPITKRPGQRAYSVIKMTKYAIIHFLDLIALSFQVYIGVDHTTVVPNSTWGRLGVRINSNQTYSAGLFILSMDHLPVGPYLNGSGWQDSPVWPAFWFVGEQAVNGEFDVYEGYNPNNMAFATLHNWGSSTWGNCTIPGNISDYYNGSGWNYQGTSQYTPHGTADVPFNNAGGGVYAFQWTQEFLRVWTFVKPNIPADILNVRVF